MCPKLLSAIQCIPLHSNHPLYSTTFQSSTTFHSSLVHPRRCDSVAVRRKWKSSIVPKLNLSEEVREEIWLLKFESRGGWSCCDYKRDRCVRLRINLGNVRIFLQWVRHFDVLGWKWRTYTTSCNECLSLWCPWLDVEYWILDEKWRMDDINGSTDNDRHHCASRLVDITLVGRYTPVAIFNFSHFSLLHLLLFSFFLSFSGGQLTLHQRTQELPPQR